MKKLLIGSLLTMFSMGAMAIDGYKNIKFGDSIEKVLSSNLCTFEKMPNESGIDQISLYGCGDFKFSGKDRMALATFINGKFKKLLINVGNDIDPLIDSLTQKYGKPSSMSSVDEINKAKAKGDYYLLFINFDKDTVKLHIEKPKDKKEMIFLIYQDSMFDKELNKIKSERIESDI
ncbi:TPA: hypothetical protein ACS72K_000093 [Providencia alcalifaciens]|uniref:hypothetical protein n=1 Tax=Providencia sp. TaxID=589 RepID=UPI003F9484B2